MIIFKMFKKVFFPLTFFFPAAEMCKIHMWRLLFVCWTRLVLFYCFWRIPDLYGRPQMGFRSLKEKSFKKKSSFCRFCLLVSRVGPVSVFGIKAEACGSLQTGTFAARNPKLFSLLVHANRTLAHFKSFWVARSTLGPFFSQQREGVR